MGEAETLEIFYMQAQVLQSMGMDALSIFFAYVICTHLVGKNLSRPIAVGLTIIYSVFFGGQLVGIFATTGQLSATAYTYMAAFPENPYGFDSSALSTMGFVSGLLPLVCGWIASVLYMHAYVRRGGAIKN